MASDEEMETVSSTSNVHKMLDVNLDMPLRDDEVLPVRTHRVVQHVEEEEEKPVKKSKKTSKKEKKSKRSKKSKEVVDEEAPIEDETPKKKKKSSKAKANGTANLLNISGEEPVLPTTDSVQEEVPVTTTTTTTSKDDRADDMEFWLSGSDATAKTSTVTTEVETPAEKNPPKSKGKKERKSKEEKKKKRSKKESAAGGGATAIPQETSLMDGLVDLEGGGTTTVQQKQVTSFKILGEDECVSMKYDIKANPMYNNQVTLAIVFSNNCSNQLVSLEFNLLDSLNAKLERPMGVPVHSGVPVPFQLPPGSANECQFGLSVQEFHVPQKLRGTLTYMIKAPEGTAQDKIDFKLPLPSSAFISPTPLPQDRFAALLGGGGLCDTKSLKLTLNNCPDFLSALNAIVLNLHLGVIEQLGDSASLYGSSIASHHVCILAKAMGDTQIGISAKGSDERLVSSLLDELKTMV